MGAHYFTMWEPASAAGADSSNAPLARLTESVQRLKTLSNPTRHVLQIRAYRSTAPGPKGDKQQKSSASSTQSKTMWLLRSNFETTQILIDDPAASSGQHGNGRVTVMTVAAPPFDQLLVRTLASQTQQPNSGGNNSGFPWAPKPPFVNIEGLTFSSPDFILRAGLISHRGRCFTRLWP